MTNRLYDYLSVSFPVWPCSCQAFWLYDYELIILFASPPQCMRLSHLLLIGCHNTILACLSFPIMVYLHAVPTTGTCLLPANLPACQSACPPLYFIYFKPGQNYRRFISDFLVWNRNIYNIGLSINVFRQKLNNLQSLQFMYVQLSCKVLYVVQERKIFIISDYRLTYSDKNWTTCKACNSYIYVQLSCKVQYVVQERKIFIVLDVD